MSALEIGEVAQRPEVDIESIRYDERQGLLAEPERRSSGDRLYHEPTVCRLTFLRSAKEPGFTLAEIKELPGLWFNVNTKYVQVWQRAEQSIATIESRIRSIRKMKRLLKKIVGQCENDDVVDEYPLWLGLNGARKNNNAGG